MVDIVAKLTLRNMKIMAKMRTMMGYELSSVVTSLSLECRGDSLAILLSIFQPLFIASYV